VFILLLGLGRSVALEVSLTEQIIERGDGAMSRDREIESLRPRSLSPARGRSGNYSRPDGLCLKELLGRWHLGVHRGDICEALRPEEVIALGKADAIGLMLARRRPAGPLNFTSWQASLRLIGRVSRFLYTVAERRPRIGRENRNGSNEDQRIRPPEIPTARHRAIELLLDSVADDHF
jgi:hypothetical protein